MRPQMIGRPNCDHQNLVKHKAMFLSTVQEPPLHLCVINMIQGYSAFHSSSPNPTWI